MTQDEMTDFTEVMVRTWGITKQVEYSRGDYTITLDDIKREGARRSRVMRSAIAPGSPAGPELMSQCVTLANDGWRALQAWKDGMRPV